MYSKYSPLPLLTPLYIINRLEKFAASFDLKDWDMMKSCLIEKIFIDYSSFRNTAPTFIDSSEYIELRKIAMKNLNTSHSLSNFEIDISKYKSNILVCHCDFEIQRFSAIEKYKDSFYHSYGKYTFELILDTSEKWKEVWRISKIKQEVERSEGDKKIHGAFK